LGTNSRLIHYEYYEISLNLSGVNAACVILASSIVPVKYGLSGSSSISASAPIWSALLYRYVMVPVASIGSFNIPFT